MKKICVTENKILGIKDTGCKRNCIDNTKIPESTNVRTRFLSRDAFRSHWKQRTTRFWAWPTMILITRTISHFRYIFVPSANGTIVSGETIARRRLSVARNAWHIRPVSGRKRIKKVVCLTKLKRNHPIPAAMCKDGNRKTNVSSRQKKRKGCGDEKIKYIK